MVTYDKPKRKNSPSPSFAILKMISSIIGGLFHYGIVVPVRWVWRLVMGFIRWNWHLTKQLFGWTVRIILTPFITVGRLLGFVPNAIPDGLSAKETEVYQRINRNYRRQKRWYLHIITFLIGMVITWFALVFSRWDFYPRVDMAVMFTLIWLVLLGTHRLWMNLGKSEDREIGEALQHLRNAEQAVYYEEEIYDEYPYASSRLEERDYADSEWDDDMIYRATKAKRQGN